MEEKEAATKAGLFFAIAASNFSVVISRIDFVRSKVASGSCESPPRY
jgi:hypothetical protein